MNMPYRCLALALSQFGSIQLLKLLRHELHQFRTAEGRHKVQPDILLVAVPGRVFERGRFTSLKPVIQVAAHGEFVHLHRRALFDLSVEDLKLLHDLAACLAVEMLALATW